jgi:hypothetical protein
MRWNGPFLTYIGKAGPGRGLGLVSYYFQATLPLYLLEEKYETFIKKIGRV